MRNSALALVDDIRERNRLADSLPDPDELSHTQHLHALDRLREDKREYCRFTRLESVHEMTGPLAPEEVVFVAGDTEDGKSLFCQNFFDDLTSEQKRVTLYIGTEQKPEVLKIKQACIRAGVRAKLILKPTDEELLSVDYRIGMEMVQAELEYINGPEMRGLAFYATCKYVNRVELQRWVTGGVHRYGIEVVIIDHIDQMRHGEGRNPLTELTATVQLIHELAEEHHIPIIVASQITRSKDPIKRHSPPDKHDLKGASGKEELMSIGYGLWRPLRTDLPPKELRALRKNSQQGNTGGEKIYQPATMGVRLLKDRLGDVPGKQCFLHVGKGGRLSDDLGMTHGIKTGGAL